MGGGATCKGRGEPEAEPGFPLCSMPAPRPPLIQHIMSKLLLAAAPIETVIKAIKGAAGEGRVGCTLNGGYISCSVGRTTEVWS